MTGLDRIAAMFDRAAAQGRCAFLPYFTVGYPDYATSVETLAQMAALDVDGFEIGIPFSDPLADGPVIQEASQMALNNGTTPRHALQAIAELRARGVQQPILLFSYVNPVLAYGSAAFVRDAKAAGADGFIIPDLPPDEAAEFAAVCAAEGLALVFFIAPTSSPQRIALSAQHASGFIYMVAVTGITGVRNDLPPDLREFIARVRAATTQKLVLGFGISTPEHARQLVGVVDGFIVASALIRAAKDGLASTIALARRLRYADQPEGV
jgi:tryptophan synthase alpha chain